MNGEARQRWRVVFRRDAAAAQLGGRDLQAAIEANLAASGLPIAGRTQMAAGLPSGLAAERELLDVILTERLPLARARPALSEALPDGHELVDCHDVWLGEPALAAQASGADYRITLDWPAGEIRRAVLELLDRPRIERRRTKGGRDLTYDLRPLLAGLEVVEDGPPAVLEASLRIDPERGTGRPEEVLAALGEVLGRDISAEAASATRLRILLAGGSRLPRRSPPGDPSR